MYFFASILLFAAFSPLGSSAFSLSRRADAVVPLSPRAGDTIVTNTNWDILWTSNGDRNVTITLRQGESQNLSLAHIITASTPNNGSYAWRAREDSYLRGLFRSDSPTSGCNYTMEFRTNGQVFYSDYFSIFREQNGGITSNMSCDGNSRPGTSSDAGSKAQPGRGSGYSTGALAGGIAGAATGMALLLGALFFLALKKDWIVTGKECRRRIEQRGMAAEAGQFLPKKEVHEPHAEQIGGEPVYQMP